MKFKLRNLLPDHLKGAILLHVLTPARHITHLCWISHCFSYEILLYSLHSCLFFYEIPSECFSVMGVKWISKAIWRYNDSPVSPYQHGNVPFNMDNYVQFDSLTKYHRILHSSTRIYIWFMLAHCLTNKTQISSYITLILWRKEQAWLRYN